jgi:hypothetical protein
LAVEALFTDLLKNLRRRVGMAFQHADNIVFEGIELAGARWELASGSILCFVEPFFDRANVQYQFPCNLLGCQSVILVQVFDFAEQFVIDHLRPSPMRLTICSKDWRDPAVLTGSSSMASTWYSGFR